MSQLREQLSTLFPTRSEYVASLPAAPSAAAEGSAIARVGVALRAPAPLVSWLPPEGLPFGGRTRTVVHATARLGAQDERRGASEIFERAIAQIETGLRETFPILDEASQGGAALDIDFPGFRARAERHAPSQAWAIRVDHGLAHTPGAVMRLQAAVAVRSDREGVPAVVQFATRVAIGGYASEAGRCAVPGFVASLARQLGLTCADRSLTGAPWHVRPEEADDFIRFLEHPARHVAVLAIGRQPSGWRLDPEVLAADTLGSAVVAMLSDDAVQRVVEVLGKEHAVLPGSARLYAAGYHRSHQSYWHPFYRRDVLRQHFLRGEDTHAMLWQVVLEHSSLSDYARPYVPFVDALASRNRKDAQQNFALTSAAAVMPRESSQSSTELDDTVRELRESVRQAREQVRELQAGRSSTETTLMARLAPRAARGAARAHSRGSFCTLRLGRAPSRRAARAHAARPRVRGKLTFRRQ